MIPLLDQAATGKDMATRFSRRVDFDGDVEEGGQYIIADDFVTSGGTIADLAAHIRSKGGNVVAAVSLANDSSAQLGYSGNLALKPETRLALEKKFGTVPLRDFLSDHDFATGNPGALTEPEGQWLLKFGSLDPARNRIAQAGPQARSRGTSPDAGKKRNLGASRVLETGGNFGEQNILPFEITKGGNVTKIDISERERLSRRLAIGFESFTDVMERQQNPVAHQTVKAVRHYEDSSARLAGVLDAQFEKVLAGKDRKALDVAESEWRQYWSMHEQGKKQQAAALRSTFSQLGKDIISTWEQVAVSTGNKARALGIQVWDAALNDGNGGYRPMGNLGKEYFPRVFRSEVWQVIQDPDSNPKLRQELEEALVRAGWDPAKARAFFELGEPSLLDRDDFFGAIEVARKLKLPEEFYEYRFDRIVPSYIDAFAKRVAQIEAFGQALKHLPPTDPRSKDLFDRAIAEARNKKTADYIMAAKKQAYGIREHSAGQRFLSNLRVITSGLLLSNPFTTIARNIVSGLISSAETVGFVRTVKGVMAILRGTIPKMTAVELGVTRGALSDAIDYVDPQETASVKARRFSGKLLKWSGYDASEKFNRRVTLAATMAWVNDYLRARRGNSDSAMVREMEAYMRRLGIDPKAIQSEAGDFATGEESRRLLRTIVKDAQFGYGLDQVPIWANSPQGRFFFQYGRWGTQRTRQLWKHVFEPAIFGEWKTDGTRRYRVRNLVPLNKMALLATLRTVKVGATAALTGEAFALLASAFFDRDRDDASLSEIKTDWSEDKKRALAELAE